MSGSRTTRGNRANAAGKPDDAVKTLPANLDIERFILGSIILDDLRFGDLTAVLIGSDFILEKHRRILASLKEMHQRGEKIDRVTLAQELQRRGELESVDGLTYLASLDDGLPHLANVDSYLKILKDLAARRKVLYACQNLAIRVEAGEASADLIAAGQALFNGFSTTGLTMRIVDIPGVRTCGASQIDYIRAPELPRGAVIGLTGDSGSGKSTLATAWARDAHDTPVLILDRENPISVIVDRLSRVGFGDCPRLRYWGGWLPTPAPLPDAPVVIDWVKNCNAPPLVVLDSLAAFHLGDENSAGEMRALMQRCRRIADLGGTVIVIHHDGKGDSSKDYRGSSDFKAAIDLGFHVTNFGPTGLLDKLVLRAWKTRIECPAEIGYEYANGRFIRTGEAEARQTVTEQLHAILRLNPGVTSSRFETLVAERGLGRNRGRQYLADGVLAGTIRRKTGAKNMKTYSLAESDAE